MRSSRVHSVEARRTTFGRLAWLLLLVVLLPSSVMANDRRPNIVVVLADDLGYGDLACYGHSVIKTPHLDQLAREGLRFTDCYAAAANCSPARTGLMTGRTPYRVGIHNWIPMFSPMHVRRSEITIATLLRNAGYSTCHVGKWHLNGVRGPGVPVLDSDPYHPGIFGFDHWLTVTNFFDMNPVMGRMGKFEEFRGDSSEVIVAEALKFIEQKLNDGEPFFAVILYEIGRAHV